MTIMREDLAGMDFADIAPGEKAPPITPGEVLRTEFMEPIGLSSYALGRAIGVPANRITAILHGTRAITADTALRLAAHFGTTAELWMGLQMQHDLAVAREAMAA